MQQIVKCTVQKREVHSAAYNQLHNIVHKAIHTGPSAQKIKVVMTVQCTAECSVQCSTVQYRTLPVSIVHGIVALEH